VNNLATGAMFDILAPNATTIECVPAILDLDHLPDMGRMAGQLPSPARTFCSSVLKPAASAPPFSIPCWRRAKLNRLDPEAYLADVINRMTSGHPINRLGELLPWNWQHQPAKLAA
jgi:hypothetical protein